MVVFITSSPYIDGADRAILNPQNEFVDRLRSALPPNPQALFVCSHPDDHSCFLLRCEDCGRIVHLDCGHLEGLCSHLESAHHFRIDPRRTILKGRCEHCLQEVAHGVQ